VNAIEKTFHMKFTMAQVLEMKNVGDMVDILTESAQP
jgi:acyl carrier protein